MSRPDWLQALADHPDSSVKALSMAVRTGASSNEFVPALVEAADIVLALADVEPIYWDKFDYRCCAMCEADPEHTDECPWKRSRLWAEQNR